MVHRGISIENPDLQADRHRVRGCRHDHRLGAVLAASVSNRSVQSQLGPVRTQGYDLDPVCHSGGLLLGGRWSDAWARKWMSGRTLVQLVGLAVLGPALLVIGSGSSGPVLVAALIIFGVGTALYLVNLWACTFEVVSPRERATAIGLLNLSNGVFSSWADPVIGHMADSGVGLGSILSFLSLPSVLAVLLILWTIKYALPRDYRGRV